MLVDFYSDFIEVKNLEENTSSPAIQFLMEQVSKYDIPNIAVTDTGPQFSSEEFCQFTVNWVLVHMSSSPHHHKANTKVESAAKIA